MQSSLPLPPLSLLLLLRNRHLIQLQAGLRSPTPLAAPGVLSGLQASQVGAGNEFRSPLLALWGYFGGGSGFDSRRSLSYIRNLFGWMDAGNILRD